MGKLKKPSIFMNAMKKLNRGFVMEDFEIAINLT